MVDINIDSHFDAIIIRLQKLVSARLSSWCYPVGRSDLVTFNPLANSYRNWDLRSEVALARLRLRGHCCLCRVAA